MLFLGVDGGATKTVAIVADENGKLYGVGYSGSASHHFVGRESAKMNVSTAVEGALRCAGIDWSDIDGVCYGLSSVGDSPMDTEIVRSFVSEITPIDFVLVNDVVNAYYATCLGEPGVVVVAGTGSIAYGRSGLYEVRVGGWGQLIGDEGSAVYIARRALQEATKAYDGRRGYTALIDIIPRALGFKSLEEVSFSVMTMRLSLIELAKIAPSIAEAAANGDRVAMEIMEESGRELALLAIACLRKLKLEHGLVGASGGVFRCKGLLWDTFKSMITSVYPYIDIIGPIYGWQPAAGAIFLAAYEKSVRMSREKLSRLMEAIRIEEDRFLGFST
ncbi:MAG: BadF/BadG/BcrA/BcrD ATPase family protein [Nitrososphaerota archaeon]|nr:BadF/BadG/BcrA/BcrD ATPase family protein [Nitrososphaerota archaeon]